MWLRKLQKVQEKERERKCKKEVNKYEYSVKRSNVCQLIVSERKKWSNGEAVSKDLKAENFQYWLNTPHLRFRNPNKLQAGSLYLDASDWNYTTPNAKGNPKKLPETNNRLPTTETIELKKEWNIISKVLIFVPNGQTRKSHLVLKHMTPHGVDSIISSQPQCVTVPKSTTNQGSSPKL